MSLKMIVQNPGLLSTIQDVGRLGYRQYGLPSAGAMDAKALKMANLLVGNNSSVAGLELTLLGPQLEFQGQGLIALAGGDLGAELNGWPMPAFGSFMVYDGDVLHFSGRRSGCRTYLTVAGGFDLDPVLGSYSTYIKANIGGYKGRALKKGDILFSKKEIARPNYIGALPPGQGQRIFGSLAEVRVMLGPQDDYFDLENIDLFFQTIWHVENDADRMGYRLDGGTLKHLLKKEIISDGIISGAIQVPGHGKPIVLLADAQTSGGYAKIATVIQADLGIFGQLMPGDKLRFTLCSEEGAREALRQDALQLESLRNWIANHKSTPLRRFTVDMADVNYKVSLQELKNDI